MKKIVSLSVKDLAAFLCRKGDLPYSFGGLSPEGGGSSPHQMLQRDRGPGWESEVPVSTLYEGERILLELSGRIDCLLVREEGVLLEEIKTTRRNLKEFMAVNHDLHWAQAKLYAALYAMEHGLDSINVRLAYLQMEPKKLLFFPQVFSLQSLKAFLFRLCSRFCAWMDRMEEWGRTRDTSILTADFPYPSFRAGQVEMIQTVYEAVKNRGQAMIQAPTGIGKTIAVLYPALQALAEGSVKKIFYLTARTTGRVIAEAALDKLRASGFRIKSISLTAKEKLCFNPQGCCSPDDCPYARGYYDRMEEARLSLFSLDAFTMEIVLALAEKHRLCPFEMSLDLALWMDCIICDVNYAFDPRITLKRFFARQGGGYVFLVDEAHNLVDRARQMFSAGISRRFLLELRRLIGGVDSDIALSIDTLLGKLEDYKEDLVEAELTPWAPSPPDDIFGPVKKLNILLDGWLSTHPPSFLHRRIAEYFFETNWFLRVWDSYDENYAACFGGDDQDFSLDLYCTDPSTRLAAALEKADSAVFFSATLTPLDYYCQILGCRESVDTCLLPSPFPRENLCLLICRTVSTFFRSREKTREKLAATIASFTGAKKGNYLVFFPSFRYMEMVHPLYRMMHPSHQIVVQSRRMSEEDRMNFLGRFSSENRDTLVGFVVMGGIFGEGIDLRGDRLSGAVVVGVGLPQISVWREVIHAHFTDRDEPGFQFAYLYPGMTRVFQAVGRVIRSEQERGAVLLIDPRYGLEQYTCLFPEEWKVCQIDDTSQLSKELGVFWEGDGGG